MSSTTSSPNNPTIIQSADTGFVRALLMATATIVGIGAFLALLWH